MEPIAFNQPQIVGEEHAFIDEALASGKLSGNGRFSRFCADWLEKRMSAPRALITPSCTAALEMTALLCDLEPGDEVIVPSFTFVSTVNAFALRGAVPVFVDVRADTLNIDPDAIEAAVTTRTRAVAVVHYAGVACDMARIMAIAKRHSLVVVEDAAHALPATWMGRPLGSIGQLSTFSFHETKNVQCGEGGALVVNDPALVSRAEVIQEKGTDRASFFRGEVDKYTWRDVGSSYLLSEVAAAFLWGQLQHIAEITARRRSIWSRYHEALKPLEREGVARRPVVPESCEHSGHLYYLLMPSFEIRTRFIEELRTRGVHAVFHYVPLHRSPAGIALGRHERELPVTDSSSERLVRLPLWAGLTDLQVDYVISAALEAANVAYTSSVVSQ